MPQTLKNNPFFHCDSSLIKLNQHHLHAMKKWETCKNSRHKTCDISVEPSTKIRVATIQLRTTQPFTNTAQTEPPTSIMASLTLRESSSPTMSEQESSCCWALVSQSTQALWRCRKFSWSSMFFSECSTCSCHTRVHSCFLLLCFHSCTRHLTALSPFFQPCTRHSTTFFSFFFLFFFFCHLPLHFVLASTSTVSIPLQQGYTQDTLSHSALSASLSANMSICTSQSKHNETISFQGQQETTDSQITTILSLISWKTKQNMTIVATSHFLLVQPNAKYLKFLQSLFTEHVTLAPCLPAWMHYFNISSTVHQLSSLYVQLLPSCAQSSLTLLIASWLQISRLVFGVSTIWIFFYMTWHGITNSYLDSRGERLKPAEQLVGIGGCARVSTGLGDLLCHVTHVVKLLSTRLHSIFQLLWSDKKVSKCTGCWWWSDPL